MSKQMMAKRTAAERQQFLNKEYPIKNIAQARNILARVSALGDSEVQYRVRKAVYGRYPQLIPVKQMNRYAVPTRKQFGFVAKEGIPALVQKYNNKGRKVRLVYDHTDLKGKQIFSYQAWKMRPSMLEAGNRNQATGMMNLRRIHARRSPKAQAIDEARSNAITVRLGDERVTGWKHDPGSADVSGVDTKSRYPMHGSSRNMGPYRGITGRPDRAIPGSQRGMRLDEIIAAEQEAKRKMEKENNGLLSGKVEVSKVAGRFKNVVVKENGKPVVAVAELDPDNPGMGNRYLRTDTPTGESVITDTPPTAHGHAKVEAVLKREFPSETIRTRHGNVTLREVAAKPNRRYSPQIKEASMHKPKQSGVDLGAGVVRHGKRQHIRME